MVKPTLKPDKEKKEDDLKDDKLKEWGILPAAVVIDETEKEKDKKDAEAAITELENLETDFDDGHRPLVVKFCACFAVFTIVLIVTCTVGSFLYFHYGKSENHKWKGWCSVKYDGDKDRDGSHERGRHGGRHGGSSSSEEQRPNWHYPRPTGPPGGQRTCDQQAEVDVDEQFERIERPQEEDCERLTILHDYNVNISAYRMWKSEICYVTWIDEEVLMDPEEYWTNMQDPEFLNQYFNELTVTYRTVLPAIPKPLHEQENGKYGEYLDGPKEFLCEGAETYWIEKIPEEELEEFMRLVEQIIQELMQLAASDDLQQQGDGQGHDQGQGQGHDGGQGGEEMPPESWPWNGPWNDDGEPLEDDDGDIDGGLPMHGYRPSDHGDGFPGMPGGGGHHDGHHGGYQWRKRRGANGNKGTQLAKPKEYVKNIFQFASQIGKDRNVVTAKIINTADEYFAKMIKAKQKK